jgi:nuclear protein localization family protein 4
MIIRFRSRDGQYRLNTDESKAFGDLLNELVLSKLPTIDIDSLTIKFPNGSIHNAKDLHLNTIDSLNLKNGDMLELTYTKADNRNAGKSISGKIETASELKTVAINNNNISRKQSLLDDELDNDPGNIIRKKGPLCKHTDKGMCEYCSPLPPWDREYQADNNIKHLSFHAYVDELNSKVNKKEGGSSYISPLKPSNFAINKKCPSGHEPWPKGICSKCQPSAITLQRQEFRMVDHVEFANSEMVNNFINSWRMSGLQRIGLLLGKYKRYEKIPLGIKCEVEAIYEFPQIDKDDGIILQEWEDEEKIVNISKSLGLEPIGIIFTDLLDSGKGDGSVICKRHVNSFFLSSLEIIFAVKWQLKYKNKCKWSETGEFSSKFVTCIISGNTNGEIEVNAYQASESAEALVKADLISASTHPDQMFIKETTNERYVPDIFYQKINEYGLQVKHNAKPSFPIEFLVVSLTHGFPEQENNGLFIEDSSFPIENRGYLGESATLKNLTKHFQYGFSGNITDGSTMLKELSNFHVLLYILGQLDVLSPAEAADVTTAVAQQSESASRAVAQHDGWKTLKMLVSLN